MSGESRNGSKLLRDAATVADWGLPYQGVAIFDFVVVWIEFAPLLLLLIWLQLLLRLK